MIDRVFLAHPRSVGEGYWQHFGVAARFGLTLIGGGARALIHAVLPNCCRTSASDTVRALNATLVEQRAAKRDASDAWACGGWVI